jgi:hypothetical protein
LFSSLLLGTTEKLFFEWIAINMKRRAVKWGAKQPNRFKEDRRK